MRTNKSIVSITSRGGGSGAWPGLSKAWPGLRMLGSSRVQVGPLRGPVNHELLPGERVAPRVAKLNQTGAERNTHGMRGMNQLAAPGIAGARLNEAQQMGWPCAQKPASIP